MGGTPAAQIDYDALAAKHGGSIAAPTVDYDALVAKHGGTTSATESGPPAEQSTDDTGVWAGVKRNTVGLVTGLYHAFADPATEQEKSDLLKKIKDQNAKGDDIPESLATDPSQATLAYHRLIDAPADQLELKGHNARAAAKDLLSHGEIAKGADQYLSGLTDSTLAAVPLAGPWLNSVAQRTEKGDVSGAATDIASALAAPHVLKGVAKIPFSSTPDILSGGWRKIGNPMGLASSGEELLTQGISPRTSMSNFKPSLERAAGDLKAYDAQNPIKSVQDLNEAIPEIKQKIWNEEIEPALQRQATKPVDMQPVADAVRKQITSEMKEFDEASADKLEAFASKLENARDVKGANALLKYVNGQLESYFQKFPAARRANLTNNPETAGWEAARAELRNQFLTTLEDAGETGVRDARLRYGAFDTLQDAVERRVNVADRAKPMSLGRIVGLAGAFSTHGASILAGELSNYLNKPDVLIRRGISKLPEPSVRTTPFAPSSAVSPITGEALAQPDELFKRATNQ